MQANEAVSPFTTLHPELDVYSSIVVVILLSDVHSAVEIFPYFYEFVHAFVLVLFRTMMATLVAQNL